MFARRKLVAEYDAFLTAKTIRWLLLWLLLCIALTIGDVWRVGNGAHVAGLAFGWLVGSFSLEPRRRAAGVAAGAMVAGAVLSTAWMPWSDQWKKRDALQYYEEAVVRADRGDTQAQAEVGEWYVRFPDFREQGLALLHKSAEAGNVDGMNNLAWCRATSAEPSLRSGEEAVRWATTAVERVPSAQHMDTLAAAYAEAKRWDEAVRMEKQAIENVDGKLRETYQAHLALFESGTPVRD
jgi:hypothetical protein